MPPYSVCCLGSLILPNFVRNAFTKMAEFDFESFIETIYTGVRFLDNVLDRTEYPLDKIAEMSKAWRRIGLGFTGLGDVFAMMGYKYGDEESKLLSHAIGNSLMYYSYRASIGLAKEKGAFPECNNDLLIESNFIKENFNPDFIAEVKKYGLRNIGINTTAPTGTQSLTVGENCSSGIEPIFSLQYDRNIRTGRGEETRKETVYDKAWLDYIDFLGCTPEKVPEFFITTRDVSPEDAIEIQSIFQKYIDHSISKTLNIPPGTTFEQYKDIYKLAYKKGLKGITTFNPEGSMKGVLEYSDAPTANKDRITPPRPKEVACKIHTTKVNKHEFTVLIGLLNGKPYEVFATNGVAELKKHKEGMIVKRKKNCYDLYVNGELFTQNLSKTYDAEYGSASRLISMALRHEIPLQFIVDQLLKGYGFVSFKKAVARELKKYIGKEEKVLTSEKCPDCGADLVYVEGCKSCSAVCGWSKCS